MAHRISDTLAGAFRRVFASARNEKHQLDFLKPSADPAYIGTLGRFCISKVLGTGGMGTVLLAFEPTRNRNVAIKVLNEELAECPPARRRFIREGKIAMSVHHPNVLATHAIERDIVRPYIVSDFMAGGSLQQLLDTKGPLQVAQILEFGIQIARGIGAIHEKGLVHSDIKPSNILLDESHRVAKICDFGLARILDAKGHVTQHAVFATPQFASPEQAQGYKFDHRSDLFSMGGVLYAMCTASPPYPGESAVAIVRELCNRDPRPIRDLNSMIPDWLVAIVTKLMSKFPNSRYQSAREVEVALNELLREHS